jgi:nicotinamide-nucleotide amidase
MKIVIVATGDEILYGELADTNSAWLSEQLFKNGILVSSHIHIGDFQDQIVDLMCKLSTEADVALFSGGLGPTEDDLTVEAVCELLQVSPVIHEPSLERAKQVYQSLNFEFTENNVKQSMVPDTARVIPNPIGLAPAFSTHFGQCTFYFLPGVPREYKAILEQFILPELIALKSKFDLAPVSYKRVRIIGLPESHLALKMRPVMQQFPAIRYGFRAHYPEMWFKMLATGPDQKQADEQIDRALAEVQKILGLKIMGYSDETLPLVVGRLLNEQHLTIATAESCTGGMIGELLTEIPGSSQYYLGGCVAYSNALKIEILGVDPETINQLGAVSQTCALEMAVGARQRFKSDLAVSVTGIAGPDGGTEEKPIGTVHFGLATPESTYHMHRVLRPDRQGIRIAAANTALDFVRRWLLGTFALPHDIKT